MIGSETKACGASVVERRDTLRKRRVRLSLTRRDVYR
jgi:hypothetical protein